MEITLAHGTGNDFVVIADPDDAVELSAQLARALCDRRRGPGGDGVLRLGTPPADSPDAQIFMDHRNADGTLAEMCGNGVRVVAKLVIDQGLVTPDGDVVRIATRSGTKAVRVVDHHDDGTVHRLEVMMGVPVLTPDRIPFVTDDTSAVAHRIDVDVDGAPVWRVPGAAEPRHLDVVAVSMGNPHGVLVVDDVGAAPVDTVGPWLERHHRFPEGVNVGFAAVRSREAIDLRVWERGVGETMACGTGACAAVVALQRLGLVDAEVAVHLPGGTLMIEHTAPGSVMMTGPATTIATGTLDGRWLQAARRGELEVDTP
jgi:diaminopimelate epimerase